MPVPDVTGLQLAILTIVGARHTAGRTIRERLRSEFGKSLSGPAFYQLMARLEDSKFVEGWYVSKEIGGQPVRERTYKILGAGVRARESAREFYGQCFGGQGQVARA